MKVAESQFEVITDCEVRHRPTGATFSTYRYSQPTDIVLKAMNTNCGKEIDDAGNEYDPKEVKAAAREILQRMANDCWGAGP